MSSVYSLHKDARNEAIFAAENAITQLMGRSIDAVLRYRPVILDSSEILVGDVLEPGAIVPAISYGLFDGERVIARQESYHPFPEANSARWQGSILGSEKGIVTMNIQTSFKGTSLRDKPVLTIRISLPPRYFIIRPIDGMEDIYYIAEIDVKHLRRLRRP